MVMKKYISIYFQGSIPKDIKEFVSLRRG